MPGGVTTVVNYLKNELEKEHEVKVFTSMHSVDKNIESLPNQGILFYWNLFKKLKKENYDIIHTQSFPICYFAPFIKTPVILSVQGYDKIYDWPKGIFGKIKTIMTTLTRGISYRFSDKIIAISNVVKENIVNRWKINSKKIEVIHNGVDLDRFKPIKTKRKDKEFRIFIYSTTKRKGFDKLLSWMPQLITEIPNIKIVVAGTGELKPSKELMPYFEFLGQVNFKDMNKLFNSLDLVLLPSIDEPFGITAAEGMACEKPAIVSAQSGVADIISNNNSIISSFADFPKNIIKLAKDKPLIKKIGILARQTVNKELSSHSLAAQHIKLYKHSINSK